MKSKVLFIISLVISLFIITHLIYIGVNFDKVIILGTFSNGNVSSISKLSLIIYSSLLLIFALGIIVPSYIKEKNVNDNLFIAYIILELVLNILPYLSF